MALYATTVACFPVRAIRAVPNGMTGLPVVVLRLQPAVQELVLQKNDGVRNFHGLAQHPVSIRYRGRSHDVQARIMGEQGFQALAVERAGAGVPPQGGAP